MITLSLIGSLAIFVAACGVVHAQPSPDVQRRISAAIEAATNESVIIIPPLSTPSSALVSFFCYIMKTHSLISNTWELHQIISETYGPSPMCSEGSVGMIHTLYRAQPRSICPVRHGVLCSVTFTELVFET
jgi:hypothetical protein